MDIEQITSLSSARREITLQGSEIAKQGAKLKLATKELIVEKKEKRKRTAELVIANNELTLRQGEKETHQKALALANKKLSAKCEYLKLCTSSLRSANRKLVKENKDKDKQSQAFSLVHEDLVKAQGNQKIHLEGLSEMMYIISHKLRQPVVQILGLTSLLTAEDNATDDTVEMTNLIKKAAEFLDSYTRELTDFIHDQEMKAASDNNK
jgi:signal transduction histidine kinase